MAAVHFDVNAPPDTDTNTVAKTNQCLLTFTISLQLQIRPLNNSDFHKNFFPLLEQLSDVGHISQDFFAKQLKRLHDDSMQRMLVCEDVSLGRIVGTGTMVVEPKFIHSASFVGHLEDLVVDHALRAKGLGQRLVTELMEFARSKGCYKVIVDCSEDNVGFYQKCGFKRKEMSMSCYFTSSSHNNKGDNAVPVAFDPVTAGTGCKSDAFTTAPSSSGEPHDLTAPERRASFSESMLQRMSCGESDDDATAALERLKIREPVEVDGLIIRHLEVRDYDLGFLALLGQLTTVGDIDRKTFEQRVNEVQRDPYQHIIVIVDPSKVRMILFWVSIKQIVHASI